MSLQFLADQPHWVQAASGLAAMALLAFAARGLAHLILMRGFGRLAESAPSRVARVVLCREVLARLAQVLPSLVVQFTVGLVPFLPETAATVIRNVAVAVTVLHVVRVLMSLLDAVQAEHARSGDNGGPPVRSIKSHVQLAKLAMMFLGGIVMIAALIDRSPLILLSGLGAMSAVLMLVFKDTLLSFTAGLQLASNDMLRVGDWIEMPQLGADGDVIDIALHTVKVQNWDKTITTIPTWRLMSESFRNWRGMSESGGRRIKRTIRLDAASVRFLRDDEIARLGQIALLRPYLEGKRRDVERTNAELRRRLGPLAVEPANQRRLTNLGSFRAYVQAYLAAHPGIHENMTRMVRTMEPSPEGVPMELYCFTSTTAWAEYEGIQSDIFDHLLAILPEFGLRLYQRPSGSDIAGAFAMRRESQAEGAGR
ncbi:mechanosensitive ion channel family protein [Zeimonas arvi]|uniref:Mechanosensing system component YbdG n=1 Tax=Zeimonas arvi TaxID=2498847 RepID=A0A5C8NVR3_9BURK|nr:mechanosensitive ion channel domain-containing protein [Zeimonas arvi]TXL65233.1 mechanosensitive ion channel [Zeimonas arvi]